MSEERLSSGVWLVRVLASDAAHETAAPTIEPAHVLIALCRLAELATEDPISEDPVITAELAYETSQLRARFARAGLDPVRLRRRIRRRLVGLDPYPVQEDLLHRSRATKTRFARAEVVAGQAMAQQVDTLHLLQAVLESPEPDWAEAAEELGVADLLTACFPPPDPATELTVALAQVRFEVLEGDLKTRRWVFTERSRLVVGRADDCTLQIPDDDDNQRVSRHHCLIEVNPPEVRICDLGSRNGTFVNGERLGTPPPEDDADATRVASTDRDLADGDLIRVGPIVLAVRVLTPPPPVAPQAEPPPLVHRCAPVVHRCRVCEEDIEPTTHAWSQDPELCIPCRHDPDRVMRLLADKVDSGAELGRMFGSYTIIRQVGAGGMGAVYLARDEPTREEVALKIMLPQVPGTEQAKRKFLREATISKLLRHRHIVRQREHDEWHGIFFIAMDYCEGGSLLELMHRHGGPLEIDRAVRIAVQALDALAYAHEKVEVPVWLPDGGISVKIGLVHRDISPGNLLFSGGMVKLADFGLSKAFDTAGLSGITKSGTYAGKPRFVPRQQVVNYRRATPAVDVWSVAACLYFMLTGLPPREFPPLAIDWRVVLDTSAVPIREREPTIPPALARVIDHALIDDPDIGFQTAQDLRDALLRAHP